MSLRLRWIGILTGVLLVGLVTEAHATESPIPIPSGRPPIRIGLDAGMFSALGVVGLTAAIAPNPHLAIEAGAGLGASGLQLSFMPKLVLGGASRFVAGVGISIGLPVGMGFVKPADTTAVWLNVDALGYEHIYANRFSFAIAGGVTVGLGNGRVCFPEGCSLDSDYTYLRGLVLPQARLGVGYWF